MKKVNRVTRVKEGKTPTGDTYRAFRSYDAPKKVHAKLTVVDESVDQWREKSTKRGVAVKADKSIVRDSTGYPMRLKTVKKPPVQVVVTRPAAKRLR